MTLEFSPALAMEFIIALRIIGATERISEECLFPLLERIINSPDVGKYLKDGFKMFDNIANKYTDNEVAEKVQFVRDKLFAKILVV